MQTTITQHTDRKLYRARDLKNTFQYVTAQDLTDWNELAHTANFHDVITAKIATCGFTTLHQPISAHIGLEKELTIAHSISRSELTDQETARKIGLSTTVELYGCVIEILHNPEFAIYDRIYIRAEAARAERAEFVLTLTMLLYGPLGG